MANQEDNMLTNQMLERAVKAAEGLNLSKDLQDQAEVLDKGSMLGVTIFKKGLNDAELEQYNKDRSEAFDKIGIDEIKGSVKEVLGNKEYIESKTNLDESREEYLEFVNNLPDGAYTWKAGELTDNHGLDAETFDKFHTLKEAYDNSKSARNEAIDKALEGKDPLLKECAKKGIDQAEEKLEQEAEKPQEKLAPGEFVGPPSPTPTSPEAAEKTAISPGQ